MEQQKKVDFEPLSNKKLEEKNNTAVNKEQSTVNNVQRDIGIALDMFVDEIAKRYQVSFASLIGIMTIKIHDLEHAAMKVVSSQKG